MEELLQNIRIIQNTDWATYLFIICGILLATNRHIFYIQFNDFIRLPLNDKYLKIYKDTDNIKSWFTISLYIIQIISFSFIIQILISYYGLTEKSNFSSYLKILTVLNFFLLSKFIIEKIIAETFEISNFENNFSLYKIYHRAYLGLIALPIAGILFYNNFTNLTLIKTIIIIFLIINLTSYLNGIRIYKKIIFSKILYFILYLCALEIAPYFFMYYFFTKS